MERLRIFFIVNVVILTSPFLYPRFRTSSIPFTVRLTFIWFQAGHFLKNTFRLSHYCLSLPMVCIYVSFLPKMDTLTPII